ncbi:MAG: OsmC family protein [Alphaproteobacteria bacterium]|nr:OsmC family protein [Alphaproteobacteria bacterium]
MYSISPHLKGLFERQAAERAGRTGPAERPVTTVKGTALFDLQFRGEVEGHSFISDERESSGGHDAGPAPMRYFIAAVMFCHKVWTVKKAALMDLHLDRLDGEISWYNDVPTPRIVYKVFIDSDNSDDDIRTIVEEGARRCNAFKTVEKATRIELTVEHNGKTILEQTRRVK